MADRSGNSFTGSIADRTLDTSVDRIGQSRFCCHSGPQWWLVDVCRIHVICMLCKVPILGDVRGGGKLTDLIWSHGVIPLTPNEWTSQHGCYQCTDREYRTSHCPIRPQAGPTGSKTQLLALASAFYRVVREGL